MKQKELTEKEIELIEAIRNFKNSKHNYSLKMEEYVRDLFEMTLLT
ncbi:MAG: ArsR family transcriptional regulator [Paludibacter sp.]|nr:ArsR family transcriptional regulator [Paludibacter sp.]